MVINESHDGQSQAHSEHSTRDTESAAVFRLVVLPENLGTVCCGTHQYTSHHSLGEQIHLHIPAMLAPIITMAIARARCSESSQAKDIHAMFRGWEKVPNVCVHTTPKYLTPRLPLSSVKIRLKMYPRRWKLRPAITVCPRLLKRSETQLNAQDVGTCKNRPTEARALLVSALKPKLVTMDGAYVSKARCGPLLQSVMKTWIQRRQSVNYKQHQQVQLRSSGPFQQTHSTFECLKTDALLFLSLHWVIKCHARSENVDLSLAEDVNLWQESAVRVLERVG
jgi:hypothetical protein